MAKSKEPGRNWKLRSAATNLIAYVMERHGLTSVDQLECPHMRALADALKLTKSHGPGKPKRGIGVHTNADMFRGK